MGIDRNKVQASAQKYLSKRQYEKAIAELQKLLDEDPNDLRTLLKIADAHERNHEPVEAAALYQEVATKFSSQGFHLKAVAIYKRILALYPEGHLVTELALARTYVQADLTSDALAAFDRVRQRYVSEGQLDRALETLSTMVEIDPDNVRVRIRYAESLSKAKQLEAAAEQFEILMEVLERMGNDDYRLKVAERLLYHRPNDRVLARAIAEELLQREEPQRALSILHRIFQQDKEDLATLRLLSEAINRFGQASTAIKVLREIARLSEERGDPSSREEALKKILEIEPGDEQAKAALKALAKARRATVHEDDDDEPEIEISEATSDEFDTFEIADDYEEIEVAQAVEPVRSSRPAGRASIAPELDRDTLVARHMTEVDVFERYGLLSKVIEQLQMVLQLDPNHQVARERLKEAFLESGRIPEAIGELKALVRLNESRPSVVNLYRKQLTDLGIEPSIPPSAQLPTLALEDEADEDTDMEMAAIELSTGELEEAESGDLLIEGVQVEAAQPTSEVPVPEEAPPEEAPPEEEDVVIFMDLASAPPPDFSSTVLATFESAPPMREPQFQVVVPDSVDEALVSATTAIEKIEEAEAWIQRASDPDLVLEDFEVIEEFETFESEPAPPAPPPPAAPPPVAPAAAASAQSGLEDPPEELQEFFEEADFYAAQGLHGEALATLEEAEEEFPDHPALQAKIAQIKEAQTQGKETQGKPAQPDRSEGDAAPAAEEEDDTFAFAEKLAEELAEELQEESDSGGADMLDVDAVFEQFKRGVQQQVSMDDSDTHFDLGIAYKEMGLLPDAIEAFKLSLQNPAKACMSHAMIGVCLLEQGQLAEALEAFERGLAIEQKTEREEVGLFFELGNIHELQGDFQAALRYFEKVQAREPGFRQVGDRIANLQGNMSELA